MVADKCERYAISHVPEGLHISLWQALPNIGLGVIVLVILTACFLTDPYQGHGRIWAGLGVVVLALVALFGVRMETWIISDSAIRFKSSLWNKELSFESLPGTPLILRTEIVPCDPDETEPPFRHVVHMIGPGGTEFGDGFRFRTRTNLDQFLETLRTVVPLDVDDIRSMHEDADQPTNPPVDPSDRWPD
jgi:hypothetical protein